MRTSQRLERLPPYAVGKISEIKRRLLAQGRDVIDLGAGDADFPPPAVAVEALRAALADPRMSRYAFQVGLKEFREAVVRYHHRRFGQTFDPTTEMVPLIGSKEGLAHLTMAVTNPGDVVVIPEPGYTPYVGGAVLADTEIHTVPLKADTGFLLELGDLPAKTLKRAALVYLNYPNNPTCAVAPRDYLERTVEVCRKHDIVLAYDNPYCEITFDGYRAPSIFEIPGARDVAIEFHSLSKSFAMTGWRLGWAVGNKALIAALTRVKNFVDTGPFLAIQAAGAATLDQAEQIVPQVCATFRERRDAAVTALGAIGLNVPSPKATMYLWVPLPSSITSSEDFVYRTLEEEAVAVLPGASLGAAGEGYLRIALTVGPARLAAAAERLGRALERMGVAGAVS
jgi:LL-diaminopimelate aminotransferase